MVRGLGLTRAGRLLIALALVLTACGNSGPLPGSASPRPTSQAPRDVRVVVLDRTNDGPLAGAAVRVGATSATTAADGSVTVTAMRGTAVAVTLDGYDPGTGAVPDNGDLMLRLRPNVVSGVVADPTGAPVDGVRVFVDGAQDWVRTDAQGRYALAGTPEQGTLIYKRAGYRLATIAIDGAMTQDVTLEPFTARALYSPSAVFEGSGRLDDLLALIDRTNVNAMVIDVKEAGGWLYYETDLPAAKESGATGRAIFDLATLLPELKKRGIYTIARMVVMKDNTLGSSQPELAVTNSATGKPWTDYRGGIWLDPYEPGVAEYIAAIAGDLADKGFDEVQLDYVRFFSDGDYNTAETTLPNTQSFRLPAIRRLFRLVSDRLATTHAFFSADVFPISFIAPDDQGIGQRPEVIMPYVDYFSPMVYPSHYANGTFGYAVPNDHPYDIINDTLKLMNTESAGLPMVIRPWIQDFGLPGQRKYTATDIEAEMKALADNGAGGWMIWNAAAQFTQAALGPPISGEDAGPTTSAQPAASPGG